MLESLEHIDDDAVATDNPIKLVRINDNQEAEDNTKTAYDNKTSNNKKATDDYHIKIGRSNHNSPTNHSISYNQIKSRNCEKFKQTKFSFFQDIKV